MKRIPLITLCAATIAFALTAIYSIIVINKNQALCTSCNVIIISADSLGADELPCLGYPMETAPNICGFAKNNILFTNNFANAPWTLPSYMSLFTSLYPASHQVDIPIIETLNPSVSTLPDRFKQAGYRTYFISNGQQNVSPQSGFGRGFTSISHTRKNGDTIQTLTNMLHELEPSFIPKKPAFIFFHTDIVHDYQENILSYPTSFLLDPTYIPPIIPKLDIFTNVTKQAALGQIDGYVHAMPGTLTVSEYKKYYEQLFSAHSLQDAARIFSSLPAKDKSIIYTRQIDKIFSMQGADMTALNRHIYDETIRTFDQSIGEFLTQISNRNLLRNTIIVFLSPHGESFGEHNQFNHGSHLYDDVLRVPLILHIPGVKNRTITSPAQLIDLYPTLLSLVGIPNAEYVSGKNIADLITGNPNADTNQYLLGQMDENYKFALRVQRWKYIETPSDPLKQELFDIQSDPKETQDISASHKKLTQFFAEKLHRIINTLPSYPPIVSPFPDWINEEHRKRLINTGYF